MTLYKYDETSDCFFKDTDCYLSKPKNEWKYHKSWHKKNIEEAVYCIGKSKKLIIINRNLLIENSLYQQGIATLLEKKFKQFLEEDLEELWIGNLPNFNLFYPQYKQNNIYEIFHDCSIFLNNIICSVNKNTKTLRLEEKNFYRTSKTSYTNKFIEKVCAEKNHKKRPLLIEEDIELLISYQLSSEDYEKILLEESHKEQPKYLKYEILENILKQNQNIKDQCLDEAVTKIPYKKEHYPDIEDIETIRKNTNQYKDIIQKIADAYDIDINIKSKSKIMSIDIKKDKLQNNEIFEKEKIENALKTFLETQKIFVPSKVWFFKTPKEIEKNPNKKCLFKKRLSIIDQSLFFYPKAKSSHEKTKIKIDLKKLGFIL